jgi:hypothetical protein
MSSQSHPGHWTKSTADGTTPSPSPFLKKRRHQTYGVQTASFRLLDLVSSTRVKLRYELKGCRLCSTPLFTHTLSMANNAKWVLSCNKCHTECSYAEIPDDTNNYFFPKKPQVPENFAHKCENCGHRDIYNRTDLRYRDDLMETRPREESSRCGEGNGADGPSPDRAFGATK